MSKEIRFIYNRRRCRRALSMWWAFTIKSTHIWLARWYYNEAISRGYIFSFLNQNQIVCLIIRIHTFLL